MYITKNVKYVQYILNVRAELHYANELNSPIQIGKVFVHCSIHDKVRIK